MNNIGRFAPSPSGLLHFGSFITALASYLHAKSKQAKWLVRIEDIDPPREVPGAASAILTALEQLGLHWDNDVIFQSQRLKYYQDVLDSLIHDKHTYYCDCKRLRIKNLPDAIYDNYCRHRQLEHDEKMPMATRLQQHHPVDSFTDHIRGYQQVLKPNAQEDFIIRRRDGLFAYHLAVVIDDHAQGVTDIMRGADLLPVTPQQISLYLLLNWPIPRYFHLPLALNQYQKKLSKQNHSPPISLENTNQLITDGLQFLNQPIPEDWQDATKEQLLQWAIAHWDTNNVPKKNSIVLERYL